MRRDEAAKRLNKRLKDMWNSMDKVVKYMDLQIGLRTPKFVLYLSESKDPRNYFQCLSSMMVNILFLVSFLLREPILFMPINHKEKSLKFIKDEFGKVKSDDNHHTFHLLIEMFINKMMKKVQSIYDDMKKTVK